MRTANNVQIREHNQNLVRKELLRVRRATKLQLAAATGLSQMTVGAVIAALLESGEVEKSDVVPSAGGRPSAEYAYQSGFRKAAVLYSYLKQGKSVVCVRVCDLFGEVLYRDTRTLDTVEEDSFDRILARAFEFVEGIGAIGLGLPGQAVDGEIVSNDYPALVKKRLLRRYEALYGVPVLFVNDVNAAVWGCRLRTGSREETLVAFYFPKCYPPGMGLVIDGKLHLGHQNFTGELQYLPIGVDWPALDYRAEGAAPEAVAKLIAASCALVAPERFMLYGDFFHSGWENAVRTHAEALLPESYALRIELSESMDADYQQGMLDLTLQLLKCSVFGGTWEE